MSAAGLLRKAALVSSVLLVTVASLQAQARYCSPDELVLSPDGRRLFVSCSGRDELAVIETQTGRIAGQVQVGKRPRGLALSRESGRLYLANSWDDTVTEIDARLLRVLRTLPVGQEPTGVAISEHGRLLYVANRLGGDVSVVDLAVGHETGRIPVGPGASYVTASSDGSRVFVTRIYPSAPEFRTAPLNEIAEIETARQQVLARYPVPGAGAMFHLAFSGDGRLGIATHLRPKNLAPLAHVEHGGVFVNGVALFGGAVGGVAAVPLDEIENYFAQPFALAIAPDGSKVYISGSGADEIAVLDGRRLLAAAKGAASRPLANDLSASALYITARIPVGRNPRGMALSGDGRSLYVANRLDDTVSCVDTSRAVVTQTFPVGRPVELTPERRGEQAFYSAQFSFGRQFSCASCHVDGVTDGLSWDLEPDGFGVDVVATRTLEALSETAPYKWNGTNPDLETECGVRAEQFFFRSQGFRGAELTDAVSFLKSLPTRPNRNRLPDGKLTPAQVRGMAIFQRKKMTDGRPILPWLQCPTCHDGPHYTTGRLADVGTRKTTDRSGTFKIPHLTNIAYHISYLHDGSARTLQEIWTLYNKANIHGVTSDLTPRGLDDLVEYLKTL